METLSRLVFGLTKDKPLKADINNLKWNIDIEELERSDCAESEEMPQAGRIKTSERSEATLLKMTDELYQLQQRYNELSHAHRHQQLDKREAADTKRINTKLRETLQKRSEDLRKAQERHRSFLREHKARMGDAEELALASKSTDDLRETVRETEARFRNHQKEMIVLKGVLNNQTADLKKAMGLKTAAEHKSEQLRSELETVRGQLQLCKDDLFRLQPMAQLPDTEIVKDFESICQDVLGWIDGEISAFEKSYPSAEPSQIFSDAAVPEVIHLMEKFPTFGEYLVRYKVHHCMHETMFSRSVYLLGLPKEIQQCLQVAEERMASLEPPRDFDTVNAWRSETLTAITATPEFVANREAKLNNIVEEIFQTVGQFFPIILHQPQSKRRLLDEVVLPAAKLASKIQVAASIYEFYLPENPFWEHEPVTIDDHNTMKMIDAKTRKTIKGCSAAVQDGERYIGDLVFPLEPSLWRINDNEASTLLRPEANLIRLYHPLGKRIKAST